MAKYTSEELLKLGKETNEMDFAVKKSELLPCPFCGNPAYDHISYHIHAHKQRHTVKCTKCNASMEYRDKKSAVKAWNTRTPKERGGEK